MRFDWMAKKPKKLTGLMPVREATSTRVATTAATTRTAIKHAGPERREASAAPSD